MSSKPTFTYVSDLANPTAVRLIAGIAMERIDQAPSGGLLFHVNLNGKHYAEVFVAGGRVVVVSTRALGPPSTSSLADIIDKINELSWEGTADDPRGERVYIGVDQTLIATLRLEKGWKEDWDPALIRVVIELKGGLSAAYFYPTGVDVIMTEFKESSERDGRTPDWGEITGDLQKVQKAAS